MGDAEAKLDGPDLTKGVAAEELVDGATLLGHAKGEPVLLARVGGELFAISASCTHYGGHLAEGLIVGETVRCPLHHACFSLRTGEALRAPALNPVACWGVESRDGRLFVSEKIERDPLSATYPVRVTGQSNHSAIVIVGGGAAGSAAAEMLRRSGHGGSITMVDPDVDAPYDRPNLSKDYLAGNAPEEWIPLRPAGFYEEHGITIVRTSATSIDPRAKRVELASGAPLSYDALLLTMGAEPVRLSIVGAELPHVHYLRTLADSRAIVERAKTVKRAVVIGSSFIGLEVAASLRARDVDVHVVAPEELPLARIVGSEIGTFIKSIHVQRDVTFHLGQTATEITEKDVVLANGERLDAELVVIGIGVRPRLALAEHVGLATDRGVTVNEFLETSVSGIWAAGDIARWPDPHTGERIRVEHWVVAQRMGQTAARNIVGARERFEQVPYFWSAHYDLSVDYLGHAERWDRIDISGSAERRDVAARFVVGGRTAAVATVCRERESLEAEVTMERVYLGETG